MIGFQRALVLTLLALLALPSAHAQEYGRIESTQASAPGFYFAARQGEPVITVTTVGAVAARGRFLLGEGATVADVLALAGGVAVDRTGKATVRLYREGQAVTETDIRALYSVGATPPQLRDGDVVEVVGLTSSVPGFFVHSQPGSEPFAVTAAGAFSAPGRYILDPGTTVGDLVALAGGVGTLGARDARTEVTSTIRLYRDGEVLLESPLADLYARDTLPLQVGDVVDLEVLTRQTGSFWRDALTVTTAVLTAAVLVERLVR